jgi:hypothetical protein
MMTGGLLSQANENWAADKYLNLLFDSTFDSTTE